MSNKLRILIAEDHEIVRNGLKLIIEAQSDMEVCGEAGDGREAIRLAEELKPDVILMDVSMPRAERFDGFSETKQNYAGS